MNYLSNESIIDIVNDFTEHDSITPAAIDYIRAVFSPIAQQVDQLTSSRAVTDWYQRNLPKFLADAIDYNLNRQLENQGIGNHLAHVKSSVIYYSIAAILERVNSVKIIYPWDVKEEIRRYEQLLILLHQSDNDKLPVNVVINGVPFEHMMSEEFTYGLLSFSDVTGVQYNVTMYGKTLPPIGSIKIFTKRLQQSYEANINGHKYYFDTAEFIQGFMTGASWAGIDGKQLLTIKDLSNGQMLTF